MVLSGKYEIYIDSKSDKPTIVIFAEDKVAIQAFEEAIRPKDEMLELQRQNAELELRLEKTESLLRMALGARVCPSPQGK